MFSKKASHNMAPPPPEKTWAEQIREKCEQAANKPRLPAAKPQPRPKPEQSPAVRRALQLANETLLRNQEIESAWAKIERRQEELSTYKRRVIDKEVDDE